MKFTLHRKPDSKAQKIPFPAMLDEIVTSMAEQLAKKSDEMASLQEEDDPLNAFDEDEIDTLEDFCINLEGLRSLLAMEDGRDE